DELDEGLRVFLPILWEPFEIGEHGRDPGLAEQLDGVLGVLVEVGVEDALVLEMQARADVEQLPPEVVQTKGRQYVWAARDRFLDLFAVRPDGLLTPLLDFGDDRKPMAGRSPRIDRSVPTTFEFEIPLFRDGHRRGFCPILIRHSGLHLDTFLQAT